MFDFFPKQTAPSKQRVPPLNLHSHSISESDILPLNDHHDPYLDCNRSYCGFSIEGLAPSPINRQSDSTANHQSNYHSTSPNSSHHHKSTFSFETIHRFARRTRSFKEDLIERIQGRIRSPSTSSASGVHLPRVSPLPEIPASPCSSSPGPNLISSVTSIPTASSSLFASHASTLRSRLRRRKRSTCSQHSAGSVDSSSFGSIDFSSLEDSLVMPPPPPPSSALPSITLNNGSSATMMTTIGASSPSRQLDHARHFIRQLTNALRYLQGVVEKDMLEQLSGAASILLEIVVTGYAKIKAHLITDHNR